MNSYKKLKLKSEEEIKELKRQLIILSNEEETAEAYKIKLHWYFQKLVDDATLKINNQNFNK